MPLEIAGEDDIVRFERFAPKKEGKDDGQTKQDKQAEPHCKFLHASYYGRLCWQYKSSAFHDDHSIM